MAQRRHETHAPDPEGGADEVSEGSEEERTVASGRAESARGAETIGGIGEAPQPPGERRTPEEGEGSASNNLRTSMEGIEVGGKDTEDREGEETEQADAEAERGELGGGTSGTISHRDPDTGC